MWESTTELRSKEVALCRLEAIRMPRVRRTALLLCAFHSVALGYASFSSASRRALRQEGEYTASTPGENAAGMYSMGTFATIPPGPAPILPPSDAPAPSVLDATETALAAPRSLHSSGLSAGACVGIVLGAAAAVFLAAGAAFLAWRRHQGRPFPDIESSVSDVFEKFEDAAEVPTGGRVRPLVGIWNSVKSNGLIPSAILTKPRSYTGSQRHLVEISVVELSGVVSLPDPSITSRIPSVVGAGIASVKLSPDGGVEDALEGASWQIDPVLQLSLCCGKDGDPISLGSGGYGPVYLGSLGAHEVAVKVVSSRTLSQQERFLKELQVLQACRHQNIVTFRGACVKDRTTFMAMEFLPGGSLNQRLAADEFSELGWYRSGKGIALDVARGLMHLHARGIAHLDIKSPNILLTASNTAKIADVGLGKIMALRSASGIQASSCMWASPEQVLGADARMPSDIFSFGVVLWEICTGAVPTHRGFRRLDVPLEAPLGVQAVLDRCFRPDPAERPTAEELNDWLQPL